MASHRTVLAESSKAGLDGLTSKPTKTRWLILFLISIMYLICYIDRQNISIAQPEIGKAFHLSKTAMSFVLAAFTWAYALGQVPAGSLGDRFGPKKVLTVIMTWWSVAAVMTGAALGMASLFTARFLLGLGEAGAFPVASRGMQLWFARSERGLIQGTTHFFSRFAIAATPLISGAILLHFGWRAIFYIFGSMGVIWSIIFFAVYRDRPEEHKRVNQAELAQIRGLNADGTVKALSAVRSKTPWNAILGSPNMWFIAVGYCCFFFGTNFYLTWYATYMREHRHLSITALGLIGSLPLFMGMLGDLVGGFLTDFAYRKTGNAKLARRIVAAPGFLLAATFLIPAATTSSVWTCIVCMAASFFCLECVIGPAWAVPMDVGGEFSGTVTGVMNGTGALFGASMTPIVYGIFFDKGFWIAPFFINAGVFVLGALIWIFLINPERSVVDARVRNG